jgi:hypothetical protein
MSGVWKTKLVKESTLRCCPRIKACKAPCDAGGTGAQSSFESFSCRHELTDMEAQT